MGIGNWELGIENWGLEVEYQKTTEGTPRNKLSPIIVGVGFSHPYLQAIDKSITSDILFSGNP
ncbi:MAG: hypothetical protein HC903_12860 [Methylacidiphilales bacterium]|nr:hypothetical protein [Candidatus Methylacidiphilales bacterium]NJR17407.1 hypothetical protein [Calothrix sp. CSU_2_0]